MVNRLFRALLFIVLIVLLPIWTLIFGIVWLFTGIPFMFMLFNYCINGEFDI